MPTFDGLNLSLSREIDDPVGAAGTDGKAISSARRIDILNQAIREWIRMQVKVLDETALSAEVVNSAGLVNYIKDSGSIALSANAYALSSLTGGCSWILSALNVTSAALIKPLPLRLKNLANAAVVTNYFTPSTINQFYVLENGNFLNLGGGATNSVKIEYIIPHVDLASGGTILIPSEYHYQILDLAIARALEELPSATNITRSTLIRKRYGV